MAVFMKRFHVLCIFKLSGSRGTFPTQPITTHYYNQKLDAPVALRVSKQLKD